MNRLCCLIVMLLVFRICIAQNLVPNGDFEQYSGCPSTLYSIDSLLYWMNPAPWSAGGGSPDYFNQCDIINNVGVPINFQGFQPAHSGGAYCGIYIITFPPLNNNWREYIEVPLLLPLTLNTCYHFEMYINLSNNSMYSSDNVGVYFSDSLISVTNNSYVLPFTPQINITGIYPDSLNWVLVSGNYVAHGGENYLVIGNFMDNSNTDTTLANINAMFQGTYFYIDDVSLTQIPPCNTGIDMAHKNETINIFPNPFSNNLSIVTDNNELSEIILFDVISRNILQRKFTNSVTINTEQLAKGIYVYEVRNKNGVIKKGKVVKD